ncbi:MAG: glycosyltransferase family 2 protein [Methylomonas sp.]|nr:glycosyltransferase family 2 protein [Methylomonas sp.]PPD22442.1 MAG: L-rhamnosyltransferase [Methylomonas sp.]PPD42064.1 MAG: L-rhamnosyltransferase [Methylomonas sp.]PPD53752.1 MAG: L-rhamnosyltransferase [Methylomonas sp.]
MLDCATAAIVVSFNPVSDELERLLESVLPQVSITIVVDNGSLPETLNYLETKIGDHVHWLRLERNVGVANAQNVGIAWAKSYGATHIVLFDQDSEPANDMVARLLNAANELAIRGVRVAAVGPRYKDRKNRELSDFVRFGPLGFTRTRCNDSDSVVNADFLISSGALIPVCTIDDIGGMENDLFIDHVDTEWFLRARAKGYQTFGVCRAVMFHNLGETTRRLWFLRWRLVPIHSQFRYYYIFRNSLLILRRNYVDSLWKFCEILRLFKIAVMFGIFIPPRFQNIRMMALGIQHALLGLKGSLDDAREQHSKSVRK